MWHRECTAVRFNKLPCQIIWFELCFKFKKFRCIVDNREDNYRKYVGKK